MESLIITLLPYIAEYGIPFTAKLYDMIQKELVGNPVTAAEWLELDTLSKQTALSQLKDALKRNNIPDDSIEAKALIAKIS